MIRIFRFLVMCATSLCVLCLTVICAVPACAQQTPSQPQVLSNAVVNQAIHFDVSPPLAEMAVEAPSQQSVHVMHAPKRPKLQQSTNAQHSQVAAGDGALQPLLSSPVSATLGLSFEGVGNTAFLSCPSVVGFRLAPPDTNAAVGDTQVVQWVNVCYAVFNKSTGTLGAGPFAGTNFWK